MHELMCRFGIRKRRYRQPAWQKVPDVEEPLELEVRNNFAAKAQARIGVVVRGKGDDGLHP